MIEPYENYIGRKYGRLTVQRIVDKILYERKVKAAVCKCDCGNIKIVLLYNLRKSHVRSCGCLSKEHMINLNKGKDYKKIVRDEKGRIVKWEN